MKQSKTRSAVFCYLYFLKLTYCSVVAGNMHLLLIQSALSTPDSLKPNFPDFQIQNGLWQEHFTFFNDVFTLYYPKMIAEFTS